MDAMKTDLTVRVTFPLSSLRLAGGMRWWMALAGLLMLAGVTDPVFARRAITADAGREGPKEWPANTNRHTITIVRNASDAAGRQLIARAEGLQPDRGELAKASGDVPLPRDGKVWWCREQFGIRIPYAVTGDAVTYYAGLVAGYGKTPMKRYAEPSSALKYTAAVKRQERFELDGKNWQNVDVVTLKLEFRQAFCASGTEAFGFTKERTVVFDAQGKVLHVSGDGVTDVPVMAI
jgi:hypothetical protein